jgi:hypothetical protein
MNFFFHNIYLKYLAAIKVVKAGSSEIIIENCRYALWIDARFHIFGDYRGVSAITGSVIDLC